MLSLSSLSLPLSLALDFSSLVDFSGWATSIFRRMHTPPVFQTHTNTSYTHAHMIQSFRHSFFPCFLLFFPLCTLTFFDLVFNNVLWILKKQRNKVPSYLYILSSSQWTQFSLYLTVPAYAIFTQQTACHCLEVLPGQWAYQPYTCTLS